MSRLLEKGALALLLAAAPLAASAGPIGMEVSEEEIARWDIDVRPDGVGLPEGSGTAMEGEDVYMERCAVCHGEFGEGVGQWPVLMGGIGTLANEHPVKTVGSYWPYATTVYDYVFRAMPFGDAQSLTADETYALTAFILNASDIIDYDFEVNAQTLPGIEMPNADGFITDPRPDVKVPAEPCMKDCTGEVTITGYARKIDVTPEEGTGPSVD